MLRNFQRIAFVVVGAVILALLLFQLAGQADLLASEGWLYLLISIALVGTLFLVAGHILATRAVRAGFQEQVVAAEELAATANQRLSAVLRFSQKYVEANDEQDVVQLILRISVEMVGAVAASFVPLDERGQPLTAVNYGDLPAPVLNAWVEYLASPAVRHSCETCESHGALTQTCPLLQAPLTNILDSPLPVGIYCLPVRRGEREFGILNLYLPENHQLDADARMLLRAMLDETSLALEVVRLRRRELAALSQLRGVSRQTDLAGLLTGFLENVRETLKADFAYLVIRGKEAVSAPLALTSGDFPTAAQPVLDGILEGVLTSAKPILLGDVNGEPGSSFNVRALLVAPLLPQEGPALGAILAGSGRSQGFNSRHSALLQTLAAQAALVVQNSHLMAALQFKTMMGERNRLAREIHDGLAQTLGFLKLQAAQMQGHLERGEVSRLEESLRTTYKILSEAYLDARQAIDGLRIVPTGEGLSGWLEQTVVEFQENTGLQVSLVDVHHVDQIAPEVQAQLIRVIQEALNNIRKHAHAGQAWVSSRIDGSDLILEVRDDGVGFSPEDIPGASQYGLQGMRERTELIGAEFQIISRPRAGTTVRVRLPLSIGEAAA